ncbi:hypothetical protein NMY22_g10230 [Coprinellus aureogranulatus]|nr:hypothetical protein NMY22_g10230 [Coprinellus aureogranulatus]
MLTPLLSSAEQDAPIGHAASGSLHVPSWLFHPTQAQTPQFVSLTTALRPFQAPIFPIVYYTPPTGGPHPSPQQPQNRTNGWLALRGSPILPACSATLTNARSVYAKPPGQQCRCLAPPPGDKIQSSGSLSTPQSPIPPPRNRNPIPLWGSRLDPVPHMFRAYKANRRPQNTHPDANSGDPGRIQGSLRKTKDEWNDEGLDRDQKWLFSTWCTVRAAGDALICVVDDPSDTSTHPPFESVPWGLQAMVTREGRRSGEGS